VIGIIAIFAINGTGSESQQVSNSSAVTVIENKTLHISGMSALTLGYGNQAAVRDLNPEPPVMRNSSASNSTATFSRLDRQQSLGLLCPAGRRGRLFIGCCWRDTELCDWRLAMKLKRF
jgi:hypothetical protein